MVKRNLDRKLCSLLVDGTIGKGKGLNQYQFYRYRYVQLKKTNPKAIYTMEKQVRNMLENVRTLLNEY